MAAKHAVALLAEQLAQWNAAIKKWFYTEAGELKPLNSFAGKGKTFLDVPPLKAELRKFVDWVSNYTLSPRGMVVRMALRMGEHLGPARERVGIRLVGPQPHRMTAARNRVLAVCADGLVRSKGEIAEEAGVSVGVIDGLVDEQKFRAEQIPQNRQRGDAHRGYDLATAMRIGFVREVRRHFIWSGNCSHSKPPLASD